MTKKYQLDIDYKLDHPYQQKLQQLTVDSKVSFQHIQTPGWSSIINTEPSADHRGPSAQLNHNKILEKLNKLKEVNLSSSNYKNIRVPDKVEGNLMIWKDNYNLTGPRPQKQNSFFNDETQDQTKRKQTNFSSHQKTSVINVKQNSMKKSNISHNESKKQINRSGLIVKNLPTQHKSEKQIKRFNQISVYEHLYAQGKRQKTKKMMEQLLQEEYRKNNVLLFKPMISAKSQQLAQIKFSRLKERQQLQNQLQEQYESAAANKHPNAKDNRQQSLLKQKHRYKIINKLFYFLSQDEQTITKASIVQVVEQLPLICIKAIQKIISEIYSGRTLTWLQFLSQINNKKRVPNKQGLVIVFEKWYSRSQKIYKQNSTKQNTRPH